MFNCLRFRIIILPSEKIGRTLEVGLADGAICTFKELIFELKQKFPEDVAFSLYPKIALFDESPQIAETYHKFRLSFKCLQNQQITEKKAGCRK
jgi:hypothetical protein